MKHQHYLAAGLCGFFLTSGFTDPAVTKGRTTDPEVALTDAGKGLATKHATMQTALKAEIQAALPKRDDARTAAWLEAIKAEEGPAKEAVVKAKAVATMQAADGNLRKLEETRNLV